MTIEENKAIISTALTELPKGDLDALRILVQGLLWSEETHALVIHYIEELIQIFDQIASYNE